MDVTIRILHERSDRKLLRDAWRWINDFPEWFRDSFNIHKESLSQFLLDSKNELLIGIFIDNQISSVIRFVPMHNNLYELHLMTKRGMDFEVLFRACLSIKAYVFDHGMTRIGGWIPTKNRHIIKLYKMLGFYQRGEIKKQGMIKKTVGVWCYFESNKS